MRLWLGDGRALAMGGNNLVGQVTIATNVIEAPSAPFVYFRKAPPIP
ncbi:MAG: hypothetical protein PHU25_10475 [Deltaproteobacteria bacterium]|nr:hypothetical protein [Deltaproteobacteria bacterium]